MESPQRATVHRTPFVELVATPAAAAPVDGAAATPISLRLGDGFELHLPPGFDADSLRRAVEVLQPIAAGSSRRIGDAMAEEPAR